MVDTTNKGVIRLHARPIKELTSPIVQMRKEKIGFCSFSTNKKYRKLKDRIRECHVNRIGVDIAFHLCEGSVWVEIRKPPLRGIWGEGLMGKG